jgi:hypothetical protein
MTRVILNGTIKGLSGRIGNLIFRQLPDGTTVVSGAPPKKTGRDKKRAKLKRSAKQQAHNSRFQEAIAYARWADDIYPIYAELAAVEPMKTAYNFALSDWWHAPEIHGIQPKNGCILVEATDNILVTRVRVTVLDKEGGVLETGEALRGEGDVWEFASRTEGKTITAEAWDLAGNVTKLMH